MKYQKAFHRGAFREGISRAGFTLGRGGGKTGLASALALSALLPDSPLHRMGFECAVVASSFAQATICGRSVKTSLELMGKDFGRKGDYRVQDSQNMFAIENLKTKARFRVYGSDSKRAHGLRPNLLLLDEPAQWEVGGEKLAAALRTALGKKKGAKLLAFGTRPDGELHWFKRMLSETDPAVFSMVFATERKCDPFNDWWWKGELTDACNLAGLRLPLPNRRGQGWKDGGQDIRAFKTELMEGRVYAPESLAMRAAFAEARVLLDPAGNEKLAKQAEAGRRARDDLANAIIMAISEGARIHPKIRTRKLRYFKA